MNDLRTFNSNEFGEIRTVTINKEPWFVGKDVAEALGYKDTVNAIKQHIDESDKQNFKGGETPCLNIPNRGMTVINESGMYALIFGSKLESAKRFKRWVTSEVLPAIRKEGVYLTDQKAYDITHNPESLADLLLKAGEQLKEKELIIKEMEPKALFADTVKSSKSSILVGELAKILRQNGINIGQNRLFEQLRKDGYLIRRRGTDWNMPTQRSLDLELFEIKESTHIGANGEIRITKTPKVTGKGQIYFINRYLNIKKEPLN